MAVLNDLPVGRWLATDDEAFDEIYRTYRPALLAFCRSRLVDSGDAEDACQEAFLRAYRALPRFDRTQRMWPWLATIAANVCTDMKRRRRAVPLSSCDTLPREAAVDPDELVDRRARGRLVGAALRELPESYRRPVYFADAEGWSYQEIAAQEQRSVASVRTSLMRGRVAFKAKVQALAEDRGMWPLAAFPFSAMRARFVAWRATKDADGLSAAAPSAFSLAQAAAATFAVLSTMTMTAAAAEVTDLDATRDVAATIAASTSEATPGATVRPEVDSGRSDSRVTAPLAPVATPTTNTAVDLEGDKKLVTATVALDADNDGDDDLSPTIGLSSDCNAEIGREQCEAATDFLEGGGQ